MKLTAPLILIAALLGSTLTASAVDYAKQVAPILSQNCAGCHSVAKGKIKGKFAVDRLDDMKKQVKAGQPDASSLVVSITLPADDDDAMPPKDKSRVPAAQIALIKQWIAEGASFDGKTPPPATAAAPAATPGAPAAAAPAVQKWKNAAGTEIEATFEGMEGADFVLLKVVSTGLVHKVPLTSLSPESQTLAKNGGK